MVRFWDFNETDDGENELRLDGEIASETWWGDKVTPALFRAELAQHPGDVTVWINSPGGDVFAASVIYTALKEHKGRVTVKIDSLAASAASVIAMAGDRVLIAPTAYMMVHNPWTIAAGDSEELRHTAKVLDEIAEGIATAYAVKTGLPREKLDKLMAQETWMNAISAKELGFADEILYIQDDADDNADENEDDEAACNGGMSAHAARVGRSIAQGFAAGFAVERNNVVYARARSVERLVNRIAAGAPVSHTHSLAPAPDAPAGDEADVRRALEMRMKLMASCAKSTNMGHRPE